MRPRLKIALCSLALLIPWALLQRAPAGKLAATDATSPAGPSTPRATHAPAHAPTQAHARTPAAEPGDGEADDSDTLTLVDSQAGRSPAALFPANEVGKLLEAHVRVASTPSVTLAEAEAKHEASLKALRSHARESSRLLIETYRALPAEHYTSRWIVASALAELGTEEAYQPLKEIALAQLPEPADAHGHDDGPAMHELTYRMVAADGLAALAREGSRAAEADLLAMATGGLGAVHDGVRVRAIKGYLAAGDDTERRAALLKRRLPESDHWAVTLDTIDQAEFAELSAGFEPPGEEGAAEGEATQDEEPSGGSHD